MPRVRGTKRKWYIAVTANCRRDRSTSSSLGIQNSMCGNGLRRNRMFGHGPGIHRNTRVTHEN